MNNTTIEFYRSILADLSVDRSEATELDAFLHKLQPPPDKLVWLRAQAFRIGCEFLTDDRDQNVSLLKTINYLVHAVEKNCLEPKPLENRVDVDTDTLKELYRGVYTDLKVDTDENETLASFFRATPPNDWITARATAFQVACEFLLSESRDTNVALLRCINVVVHNLEQVCMTPKEYKWPAPPAEDLSCLSLEQAVQQLWALDANRLQSDDEYVMDVQRGKKPYWKEDSAHDPLFRYVNPRVWKRPTYRAFVALLDNYTSHVGVREVVTAHERREMDAFLKAILQTAPMQFCHHYCRSKDPDRIPADAAGFSKLLYKIWFELYRRTSGTLDSSGFEHVFCGEIKNGAVSGFHNWIQFYLEEKKGELDYRGYLKPRSKRDALADSDDHLLTLQFHWKGGVEKFAGTFFVGVSPEFEMALYTMCFLVGDEENELNLDTGTDLFGLRIKCYRMARDKIGTTFPEITSHYEQ